MRSTYIHHLASLSLALLPTLVCANDSSAFVEQIVEHNSFQASEGRVAGFSTLSTGHMEDLERRVLPRFSSHDGKGTHSVVNQQGRRNRATVQAMGNGNITLQRQQGFSLASDITLMGQRNAIAVDQRGANLESDIRVIGGNKVIFHVQRGTGPSIHHQPLLYTGPQREVEVILDTPKGRLNKSVSN